MIYPSEAVLVELGRVTWAAINLEDMVGYVCRWINQADRDNAPASVRIDDARAVVDSTGGGNEQDRLRRWLDGARQVLEDERHQILHARPLTFMSPDGTETDVLGVMPRPTKKGRPGREYTERPLTVAHLRESHDAIVAVAEGWRVAMFDADVVRDLAGRQTEEGLPNPSANPSNGGC
ncbi:hypothetical protein ACQPXB_35985 [Amycolatopsis sp. CA-161197]|uniref:hypothetical protein n=1 Tax=Amycolatopsis sp. CA-161197 TaxID=3239922 RepID=UPI003D8BE4EC